MKFKKIILKVLMCLVMLFSFVSCKAPAEMCGKYNLTSISGIPGVNAASYEYNYIMLEDDYTYVLENKIYGTVTAQTGKWSYDKETSEITFICQVNSSTYSKDIAIYDQENKTLTITSTIESLTIKMVLTLEISE